MNTYDRIFGAGPRGAIISLLLLLAAWALEQRAALPPITEHAYLRYIIFAVCTLLSLVIITWSLKSLPPGERGRKLAIAGAFKYVRHPLYAAFASCFVYGLAVLLNNWIYILWAVLMLPFWQLNVIPEEKLMLEHFGDDYSAYCKKTWRFFPKLV